jgi:thiamine biosynthesis lipoprotein
LVVLSLSSSRTGHATLDFGGPTMGTTYRVLIDETLSEDRVTAVRESVTASLDEVNRLMSTWDPESEISRFNRYRGPGPFRISPPTLDVLSIAIDVAERSGGAFDPTVAPLVEAWGFGPTGAASDRAPISEVEGRAPGRPDVPGFSRIAIDAEAMTLVKLDPDIELDLSGVAKGYAVDRIAEALAGLGLSRFMVEIGGELRATGTKRNGRSWRAGIEAPVVGRREVFHAFDLVDSGLATSGDYRNFREVEEGRIGHIIDPRSGRPVDWQGASVTVLHEEAAVADAWATALSVLGPVEGHALAEREGLAALFLVQKDDRVRARPTTAFRSRARADLNETTVREERW